MTRGHSTLKTRLSGVCILAVLLVAISSAFGQDAVKLSGLWVQPVTVHTIQQGQVHYQTRSGNELVRSAKSLEGLKLGRYPALGEAETAVSRGDDTQAVALWWQVAQQAEEPWVRWYVGMKRVQALARLDKADSAAGLYIDMVVSGADLYFVAQPPVDVVAQADAAVRIRVLELTKAAIGTVGPEQAALLQKLTTAAGTPADLDSAGIAANPESGLTGRAVAVPALSASVPPGSVANLYRRGSYDQALLAAEESLTQPGKTASKLYLKGMVQLALAESTGDRDGYKSAGLSFMRVVVYFPRSAVAGPATLEAGYVHELINRNDIASRLYDRARPLIDQQEDPVYYQRLNERIASVKDAPSGE